MFGAASRVPAVADPQKFDPRTSLPRLGDALRFLADLQRAYYRQMHGHLKTIGVRAPIAGTNQTFFVADYVGTNDSDATDADPTGADASPPSRQASTYPTPYHPQRGGQKHLNRPPISG
jgi:hypothetical protein